MHLLLVVQDQKVSWHATPFEERLEKALSEDKLIAERYDILCSICLFIIKGRNNRFHTVHNKTDYRKVKQNYLFARYIFN